MMTPVKVKCKKCGREFKSDEFVLDPVYKMMVCRECVKERRTKEFAAKKTQQREQTKIAMETQIKKEKPAGWDSEDAEIERTYKAKKAALPDVEKIDDQRVKYTCKKCKYEFVFNVLTRVPGRCPYCGAGIEGV
jgi:DNA-directed RNA polymerase subunit RPC12/RpoP